MLKTILERLVETAYQDMRGVMGGKKDYRLRHKELAEGFANEIEAHYLSKEAVLKAIKMNTVEWEESLKELGIQNE